MTVHVPVTGEAQGTEVPRTLAAAPPPRLLSAWDQATMWGNLGVSLLLPLAAAFVFVEGMAVAAALTAVLVGALIGNVILGLAAVPGAETGAPSMVLIRGLLGRRGSFVPTALNIAQNVGWATIEVAFIAEAASRLTSESLRPVFIVGAAGLATLMALRPLGVVRGYLRRVAVWLVMASTAYLLVMVVRAGLPPLGQGSWTGFWGSVDVVVSLPVSWAPLAADYSRHSRSGRAAFTGAFSGYGVASVAFFTLGILALAAHPGDDVVGALLAIPAGGLALLILVFDEVDEVFANVYSTVASTQNVVPRLDRRVGAVLVGAAAAILAFPLTNWLDYEKFLLLIGSVFVPLFATFIVDYFAFRRHSWDTSDGARTRWLMLIPWIAGFTTYQLINPGQVGWWVDGWTSMRDAIGFAPPAWMNASLTSFAVAAVLALAAGAVDRRAAVTS